MKRNIGPDGIRIRAFVGVLFIVFAMGLTTLLTAGGAPIALRMVVFVPVLISFTRSVVRVQCFTLVGSVN